MCAGQHWNRNSESRSTRAPLPIPSNCLLQPHTTSGRMGKGRERYTSAVTWRGADERAVRVQDVGGAEAAQHLFVSCWFVGLVHSLRGRIGSGDNFMLDCALRKAKHRSWAVNLFVSSLHSYPHTYLRAGRVQRQGRVHVVVLGDEERGHLPAARLALYASIIGAVELGKMCVGGIYAAIRWDEISERCAFGGRRRHVQTAPHSCGAHQ